MFRRTAKNNQSSPFDDNDAVVLVRKNDARDGGHRGEDSPRSSRRIEGGSQASRRAIDNGDYPDGRAIEGSDGAWKESARALEKRKEASMFSEDSSDGEDYTPPGGLMRGLTSQMEKLSPPSYSISRVDEDYRGHGKAVFKGPSPSDIPAGPHSRGRHIDADLRDIFEVLQEIGEEIPPPNPNEWIVILVLGETGVGKTSFFEFLRNVGEGRTPANFKEYHLKSNENGGSQSNSQTKRATFYEFVIAGYKFRLIDTPGLNDTGGLAKDDEHIASIMEILKTQSYLNGVLIVTNATKAIFNVAETYVTRSLLAVFPKQIANNIIVVGTNCSISGQNMDIAALAKEGVNPVDLIVIQNPFALWKNLVKAKAKYASLGKPMPRFEEQRWNRDLAAAYEDSLIPLAQFLRAIAPLRRVEALHVVNLYKNKEDLENQINQTARQQAAIQQTITEREDFLKLIDSYSRRKSHFSNHTQKVSSPFKLREVTVKYNTICTSCQITCHHECQLPKVTSTDEHEKFLYCACFGGNTSTVCVICNCGTISHIHGTYKWSDTVKELIEEVPGLKAQYDLASTELQKNEILEAAASESLEKLKAEEAVCRRRAAKLWDMYAQNSMGGSYSDLLRSHIATFKHRIRTERNKDLQERYIEDKKMLELKLEVAEKVINNAAATPMNTRMVSRNPFSY